MDDNLPTQADAVEIGLKNLEAKNRFVLIFISIVLAVLGAISLLTLTSLNRTANDNQKNIAEHRDQVENANSEASKQLSERAGINQAKLDIGLCIISVSPTVRTPEYVKGCYDRVEKSSGLKLDRFGDGVQ